MDDDGAMEAMMYDYKTERPGLFTDAGQRKFLKVRDAADRLLVCSGAFMAEVIFQQSGIAGGTWETMACLDRLVELGEIRCVYADGAWQERVYVRGPRA